MYREWEDSENRSLGYANNLAKPCALLQIKLNLWVKEGKAVPGERAGVRTASRCAHTHKKNESSVGNRPCCKHLALSNEHCSGTAAPGIAIGPRISRKVWYNRLTFQDCI